MRVILLEDEAKVRGYLLESFEREGFTTLSFTSVPISATTFDGKNRRRYRRA